MEPEIIVALIASFASLILGVLNNQSNRKISIKQNDVELKKTKIETLERRSHRIDDIRVQISNRVSNVYKLDSLEDVGAMANFYSENFKDVLKISHLINKDFSEQLSTSLKKIEHHTGREMARMNIDYNEAFKDVKEMSVLNNLILIKLGEELNILERKIIQIIDI